MALVPPSSEAVVKAGSSCPKLGKTSIALGKKFTCIKVKGKLVWNVGVTVKKLPSTPSSLPVPSKSPIPSPAANSVNSPNPSPSPTTSPTASIPPSPSATPLAVSPSPTPSSSNPAPISMGGATSSSGAVSTCESGVGVCSVGDKGPGGGVVFYVQSGTSFGTWKYLEVAPLNWKGEIDPLVPWCPASLSTLATLLPIGTGAANTRIIFSQCSDATPDQSVAARVAANYRGGGKSDWFLPSKNELLLLFQAKNFIGQISSSSEYWSSSQDSTTRSWAVDLATGASSSDPNMIDHSIRPVRTFG